MKKISSFLKLFFFPVVYIFSVWQALNWFKRANLIISNHYVQLASLLFGKEVKTNGKIESNRNIFHSK